MNRTTRVILDCSGSMEENGKQDILLNASRTLRRWALRPEFGDVQTSFYLWNDDVRLWNKGSLHVQGSADVNKLGEFIVRNGSDVGILLLSDGCFPPEPVSAAMHTNGIFLLPVAVGADANLHTLTRVSSVKRVYQISSLIDVFERLYFRSDQEVWS